MSDAEFGWCIVSKLGRVDSFRPRAHGVMPDARDDPLATPTEMGVLSVYLMVGVLANNERSGPAARTGWMTFSRGGCWEIVHFLLVARAISDEQALRKVASVMGVQYSDRFVFGTMDGVQFSTFAESFNIYDALPRMVVYVSPRSRKAASKGVVTPKNLEFKRLTSIS